MIHFRLLILFSALFSCTSPKHDHYYSSSSSSVFQEHSDSVEATHGVIASAHPLASQTGLRILKKGGNAIDAAIAASFTISVVRPQSTGLGGGGFALVYLKRDKDVKAYDFRERAPGFSHRDMYIDPKGNLKKFYSKGQAIGFSSEYGPLAVGVPGLVAGLFKLHRDYGTLPIAELMRDAIEIAEKGFPLYPSLVKRLKDREKKLRAFASTEKIFLPKHSHPKVGDILVQKELAKTLRLIQAKGEHVFYKGTIAEDIEREMIAHGGILRKKDLENYKVIMRKPLSTSYKSYKIVGMPPPSSGGVHIIQILNILRQDHLHLLEHNSANYLHLLAEAMRRAFADRSMYLGDPDFFEVPVKGLLSQKYASKLRESINLNKASPSKTISPGNPLPYESPTTAHISVVDRWGNVVSTTQSVNAYFGSGMSVGGILLNNEMDDFSSKPGKANLFGLRGGTGNSIEPGKTMLSSMSPTLIFDEKDNFQWSLGSPGGPRIITAVLQTTLNLIDFKRTLPEAVEAGRIHHQWFPDQIFMEKNVFSKEVQTELKQKGHHLHIDGSMFGDIEAVGRYRNLWIGVSDKRSDGKAMGY